MKKYLLSLYVVAVATLSGCAFGPLVSHETARTVGNSNHELIGGYGMAGFVFKWNYGLTENLDLGLHLESLNIGLRAKYAFINSNDGWSLATAFGTGVSLPDASHFYGDLIGSYMTGAWEPYGTLRFVHVKNNSLDFKDQKTGQVNFTVPSSEYDYGQFILGTRYWFTPHWLFSIEASSIFVTTPGLKFSKNIFAGLAFGYRF